MSVAEHKYKKDILNIIQQFTSYKLVDENTKFNEICADINYVLGFLPKMYPLIHISKANFEGKRISEIVSYIEKGIKNKDDDREWTKESIYKSLRSCTFDWFNEYVYTSDARINFKQLTSFLNETYGISLIKKDLTRFHEMKDLISFIEEKIKSKERNNVSKNSLSKSTQMVYIDKSKIEYVIGIDLGHGETSAAICALQWDKSVEQLEPAKDLEMGGNKKVIPSAITILDNGNAYIGDSAFNPEILKQANVNVCFKKAPKDINGVSERLMIRFMQEVYRRIRENNSAMLTDDNHLVYIATPSGWDKETQDLYLQMAKQAGLPVAGVTKESRAAFVRAQHDITSGIGKYIEKGAVVFDMGSSTLDFTFMRANSKLIDNGYDCGASFIEKTIFKDCEENNPIIRKFEEKYDKLTSYLLFEARKVKEQVYFDPSLKVKKTINFEDFIDDEDFEDDRYKMVYKPGELDDLLEKVGYIKEIENAAIDFANNHIHNATIYGVFLTGGASRMDFIKPLVSRCWNVPESQIYRDQDPSLTISQGVAEVARMDLRTEGMDTGLEDEINSIIANDTIFYCFSNILGSKLKDDITTVIANVITAFKDDKEDWTLYELRQTITQYVNDDVRAVLAEAPQMLNDAIENTTQEVRNKVSLIIANYSNQSVNVTIPQLVVGNININGINLDSVIESISETIEVESSNWIKYVLTGVGAIFGFIGMGIGYLSGKIFGEKELSKAEKRDKAMSKSLDSDEREQVYNALAEKWDDIVGNINNAIDKSISQNNKMHQTIKQATNNLLEDYKKALKNARILID